MLSIRTSRRGRAVWLMIVPLQWLYGLALIAMGSQIIWAQWDTLMRPIAMVLAVGCGIAGLGRIYQGWSEFVGGRIHFGLVANSRTLAVVRFRAPTLYIKRRDVASIGEEDNQFVLRDGTRLDIWCHGVLPSRMRSWFLYPLYAQWRESAGIWSGARRVQEDGER